MASARSGHATYYLDVSLVSQSQAGNTSVINIHLYAQADSGWSGFASGIGWSATGNSGTFSFNGSSIDIANYNITVGHDAAGNYSGTITAHTNATGTSTFAGPVDLAQGITLPRIPKVPSAPGIAVTGNSALAVTLNVTSPADNGGSAITSYVTQYSKDGGAWTGTVSGSLGSRTYSNLVPGSYVFRVYAVNGVGNGAVAQTGTVVVLAGGYVWNGTSWVASQGIYVWNGTAWVLCLGVFVWNGASWVAAL